MLQQQSPWLAQVTPFGPLHQHSYVPPLQEATPFMQSHFPGQLQMSFGGPLPQPVTVPPQEAPAMPFEQE